MLDIFRTLPGLMADVEGAEEFREALVFAAWRRIAGEALAEHTAPIKLGGSTLTVAVRSLTWQRHLKDLGGQMLFKINAALGTPMVSYIQLEIDEEAVVRARGEKKKDEDFTRQAAQELTPDLLEAAALIEDEELRRQFLAAAGNCLVRRQRVSE